MDLANAPERARWRTREQGGAPKHSPLMRMIFLLPPAILLAACAAQEPATMPAGSDNPAAGTRPAGEPNLATYEGVLSAGVECAVLTASDGRRWSMSTADGEERYFGKRVRVTAEVADASFCMEGEATLIPHSITLVD